MDSMLKFTQFLIVTNVFLAIGVTFCMWASRRPRRLSRVAAGYRIKKEIEGLPQVRTASLTEPLTEKTRPSSLKEIAGQIDGIRRLRAALCGPHPQHVLIYGPPGVGKTAAARLMLEEAKQKPISPFGEDARFIEVDATIVRFDERGFADPLIGSVHDPIYQGGGNMGNAGIPQPKPGAVTRAHGGILFIDEIGELHPLQLNKLLKVLEDRRVFFESAYYVPGDTKIPDQIHDIFKNGVPADFRLIGATTRLPDQLPPALRSRCVEIFFGPLSPQEIGVIAANAAAKLNLGLEQEALNVVKNYAANGRDAVNIIQLAGSSAITENRRIISGADAEWVVTGPQYNPRLQETISPWPAVGLALGLGVQGVNVGVVLEVEAATVPVPSGTGKLILTGLVEEEVIEGHGRQVRRKSTIKSAAENVLTALRPILSSASQDYDIHINFPGGMPVDGPSAGLAMAAAVYSSMTGIPVNNEVAMTGEVSIRGLVKPVGGIIPKIEAAVRAGVKKVYIPAENNHQRLLLERKDIAVLGVRDLTEVLDAVMLKEDVGKRLSYPAKSALCV